MSMCGDYFRSLLDQVNIKDARLVMVIMNSVSQPREILPDGRVIFPSKETRYIWKTGETHNLLTFHDDKLPFVNTLRIEWEDGRMMVVNDHFTHIHLSGFYEFPFVLKKCVGDWPAKITMNFH